MRRGYTPESGSLIPAPKRNMNVRNAKFMRNLSPGVMMNQKALTVVSRVLLAVIVLAVILSLL